MRSAWAERLGCHVIAGRTAILSRCAMLESFAESCGQVGAMQDLAYFLTKPGLLQRIPQLLLIFDRARPMRSDHEPEGMLGALLLFHYRAAGWSTGMYTTNDRSGRNTLVAPAPLRSRLAEFAARRLVEQGAHIVMISFREGPPEETDSDVQGLSLGWKKRATWSRRERQIAEYLPLESTYDATLAGISPKTRTNLRYYRRRAEKQLGCTFCPTVELSRAEVQQFNRECTFAVPDRVAAWRYDVLRQLRAPLLMGMRDSQGRWLSLVGARRFPGGSEILWQMNRDGYPLHSLSLVMRSYLIEHEIENGSQRFYLEGGSSHPLQHSFQTERLTDFAVLRRTPTAMLTRKLSRHIVPGDNQLATMLHDPDLEWRSTRSRPKP